jgi:hypothetical protein
MNSRQLQFNSAFKVERLALKPLKRVEGNALHPRCRAKQFINAFHAIRAAVCLSVSK